MQGTNKQAHVHRHMGGKHTHKKRHTQEGIYRGMRKHVHICMRTNAIRGPMPICMPGPSSLRGLEHLDVPDTLCTKKFKHMRSNSPPPPAGPSAAPSTSAARANRARHSRADRHGSSMSLLRLLRLLVELEASPWGVGVSSPGGGPCGCLSWPGACCASVLSRRSSKSGRRCVAHSLRGTQRGAQPAWCTVCVAHSLRGAQPKGGRAGMGRGRGGAGRQQGGTQARWMCPCGSLDGPRL